MKVCTGVEEKHYKCKHCGKKYKSKKGTMNTQADKAQGIYMWLMYNTIPPAHSNLHKQGHIETKYVLTV